MLSLLFSIISSTLFEIINFFFKNVTNFLQKTLSMMKNIIFILDKCETEHKEDSG
jgi:hypothetical protein